GWMPRVYGNCPGYSSARRGRSSDVYSGWSGTPEIVEVSMPSSRAGLDSNSCCHTCFGSRARTFNSDQLSVGVALEDLLGGSIWRAVLQQALRQRGIVFERLPGPAPGQLRGDLGRLVAKPLFGQLFGPPAGLEVTAMRDDCRPQLFDALLACRDRRDDRWLPHPFGREVHHRPQLGRHPGMAVEVGFVDNEDVGDLEDAGLDHLHAVAEVRGQDDDGGVGDGGHLELGLTHADRFQDHLVEAECSQQPDRLTRRQGQPAEVTPRTHAANED